jgi:Nif-specific regulatory protein
MEPRHLARIKGERELYRRLLDLGRQEQIEPFLREALALIVEIGEARQGYLELHDDEQQSPRWWMAHGIPTAELEGVRAAISGGIIAEAIATGQTILTPSALLDPRFCERDSVRLGQIEAVLCAPVGEDPPIGVLYLQGRPQSGVFSEEDRVIAETFARLLAPLAGRLLAEQRRNAASDPTRELRQRLRLEGIVGSSPALAAALQQVALLAPLDVNVLLTGESGTGKSHFARLIHDNGPRAQQPFIELNCAAIPETLVESELFGAAAGAHSTATKAAQGKVAAAEGGTLLLDEIAELPPASQAKLLQLVQSKTYYPLGAAQPVRANVRVIAATNADLEAAVANGRFRQDLLYRLGVLPLRIPSLAERRSDVPALAAYFCRVAVEHNNLPRVELSRRAIRALEAAEWPGNVRQLCNAVSYAAMRAAGEGAHQVEREHVFPEAARSEPEALTFQQATRRFQAELLRTTLQETGWNVVETANRLDLARSHVYNLIKAFSLERQS